MWFHRKSIRNSISLFQNKIERQQNLAPVLSVDALERNRNDFEAALSEENEALKKRLEEQAILIEQVIYITFTNTYSKSSWLCNFNTSCKNWY